MNEFNLIDKYFKNLTKTHHYTILGIGDDGAVSTMPTNRQLVSCMDTLVAGRHFPLTTSPYAIGFKSVAVNLSDLASMGATPYAILLGLSLPDNDPAWLMDFADGLTDICTQFGVELIGGDTTKSDTLTVSVTALGFVPQGQAITRAGAKVGDLICVSGQLGQASLALSHILNGQISPLQSALDLPMPRVELGQHLLGIVNSMIDISDGLGQDLGHILTASGVGAVVQLDKIPHHPLLNTLPNEQKWQHILNGGDDYELCLTLSQEKFRQFNRQYPNTLYPIGTITEAQDLRLFYHQQPIAFTVGGWTHF